eukprot:scaffold1006_cov408-Prasinococcus_capsulatus_cf.AAC.10
MAMASTAWRPAPVLLSRGRDATHGNRRQSRARAARIMLQQSSLGTPLRSPPQQQRVPCLLGKARSTVKTCARASATSPPDFTHADTDPTYTQDPVEEDDVEFDSAINEFCNRALHVMLNGTELDALALAEEVHEAFMVLEENGLGTEGRFLWVLEALLNHAAPPRDLCLTTKQHGALNAMLNQLEGSRWRILSPGQAEGLEEQPTFTTWKEIYEMINGTYHDPDGNRRSTGGKALNGEVHDTKLYDILHIEPSASRSQIRASYRKLALELHPDSNRRSAADDVDSSKSFIDLNQAYEILYDPEARRLYDKHGVDGALEKLEDRVEDKRVDRREQWTEFSRPKRAGPARKFSARDAAVQFSGTKPDNEEYAQPGDIVQYPLSARKLAERTDDITHGALHRMLCAKTKRIVHMGLILSLA